MTSVAGTHSRTSLGAPRDESCDGDGHRLDLRGRVTRAIEALGTGFIAHPGNDRLRDRLRTGALPADDYARQLVRLVYRLLFLFAAEDRGLLHPADADDGAVARYDRECSTRYLRALASRRGAADGDDLWLIVNRVTRALGDAQGAPDLGLPGLGSFLWSQDAAPDLAGPATTRDDPFVLIRNERLLDAVRSLGLMDCDGALRVIDYADVGAAQLVGIYESLLGLEPNLDLAARSFALCATAGSERKTTGSYYTPDTLVEGLLDSALEPIVADRLAGLATRAERERALLAIKVCDPAVGAGRFLIAAAQRLARHLARIRTEGARDAEPAPAVRQRALRDVIRSCLYGVDVNPMAAELSRVALWIEAGEPGAPLTFLDDRIRVGNALLGTTASLMAEGIPDEALEALAGDDKCVVARMRRRKRRERRAPATRLPGADERRRPGGADHARLLADGWCAAFVWRAHDGAGRGTPATLPGHPRPRNAMTEAVYRDLERDPDAVPAWIREAIGRLAREHRFFHWHLEYPEVFGAGAGMAGGFDVIVGNPPFLNQLESATATRRGVAELIRCRTGGVIAAYADGAAMFLVVAVSLLRAGGRMALIQPQSVLSTRDTTAVRRALLESGSLVSLWIANERVFEDASVYACALTLEKGGPRRTTLERRATAAFIELKPVDLDCDALRERDTWAHLAAAAAGIPELTVTSRGTIADLAGATADFRDQYYGLDGFLVEHGALPPERRDDWASFPPIVTTGLIDLAHCRWGEATTRILKAKWSAPRIDRARMIATGTLASWIEDRTVPKVLLATQTRVIEVFADTEGRFVPSTPLISVTPKARDDLWRLAAVLASPVCTALAMQKYAGAGLTADAIKLAAKQALTLPLPTRAAPWAAAARAFRAAQQAADAESRRKHLHAMAESMCRAYGIAGDERERLLAWWIGRLEGQGPVARGGRGRSNR